MKWIDIKKELPKKTGYYIVYRGELKKIGYKKNDINWLIPVKFIYNKKNGGYFCCDCVTYWLKCNMPN